MASSATATFFTTPEGANFRYVFLIRNTSSGLFDIYGCLIAAQYNVPLVPGGLQNIVPISSPPGWQLIPSTPPYGFLSGQTNFAGTPAASGYIVPGVVGTFAFESSTPPPSSLPFGCCFYDENNEWGFAYDGTAKHVTCIPPSEFPRHWPWPYPLFAVEHRPRSRKDTMRGTTERTIGGEDGAPTVRIIYDRFGNIVEMSPNAPTISPHRGPS